MNKNFQGKKLLCFLLSILMVRLLCPVSVGAGESTLPVAEGSDITIETTEEPEGSHGTLEVTSAPNNSAGETENTSALGGGRRRFPDALEHDARADARAESPCSKLYRRKFARCFR